MAVMAGHVFAHGGRSAKLGEPASKMALTYQIHVQYSAFSEITYDNSNKILTYGPGNIFNRLTNRPVARIFVWGVVLSKKWTFLYFSFCLSVGKEGGGVRGHAHETLF